MYKWAFVEIVSLEIGKTPQYLVRSGSIKEIPIEKSVKKTRAARRVFLTFRKSSNIPSVWIRVSKHRKPLGNSFIK